MSEQIFLTVEIDSLWLSLKYHKIYITAKTLDHCITDNQVIEEKNRKISLVFANAALTDVQYILSNGGKITFEAERYCEQVVDKNGYVLNRYHVLGLQQ